MFIYLIKLQRDNFHIIKLTKTFKTIKFNYEKSFESIDELKKFIKNKKKLYFNIFSTNAIKTTMDIPKVVKGDSTIRLMLEAKFSKEMNLEKNEINYNFNKVDETKNANRYDIDGVYESDYKDFYEVTKPIGVEVATLGIYALYSLNRYLYGNKFFISLYIDITSITVVAGDESKLIFSRVLNLTDISDIAGLRDEIIKNIVYVKQKSRLTFELVTLSGIFANNKGVLNYIGESSKIETINIEPNLIFKDIDKEIFNRYVLEFGTLVIEENLNFIPLEYKSKKQFDMVLNIYIVALLLISFWFGYEIYGKSETYFELKDRYSILKDRLIANFSKINIADKNSEEFIMSFLELISLDPNYMLVNKIEAIATKLSTLKIEFDEFKWSSTNDTLTLSFEKEFEDLFAFNEFVRGLKTNVIDMDSNILVDVNSDYKELSVNVKFTLRGVYK